MSLLQSTDVPSAIHLYDRCRTGRCTAQIHSKDSPVLDWKIRLPNYPPKAPESTPIFDRSQNIYFGCHDGSFYSLSSDGEFRWSFSTPKKIYGGPLITEDEYIVFTDGSGRMHILTTNGERLGTYDLSKDMRGKKSWFKHFLRHPLASTDLSKMRPRTIKCWSSPNIDAENNLIQTSMGKGIHSIDVHDLNLNWTFDLGSPRYHSGGVAISEGKIYCTSQRSSIYCIDTDGNKVWSSDLPAFYDSWSTPSIEPDLKHIYITCSLAGRRGAVICTNESGERQWKTTIAEGIRGSATISHTNFIVICGLGGSVYYLNKSDGQLLEKVQLSNQKRGMWTSATIDLTNKIFLTTKNEDGRGSLSCLSPSGEILWQIDIGKAFSTPVLSKDGKIYAGSWEGDFCCYNLKT